jgi:hypothetical protein
MKIEDPAVVKAREEKQKQSVNHKRNLQRAIEAIDLPVGMRWVDADNLQLDRSTDHIAAWVTYLVSPVGTDDWGVASVRQAGYYVKGVRFGWLTESASPSHVRERIEEAVYEFMKEIEAGTAQKVKDGDLIPDDCRFRSDNK